MSIHNTLPSNTIPEVRVGDTVKILALDSITQQLYPELLGMLVEVTAIDTAGDLVFKYTKPVPIGAAFERMDRTHLTLAVEDGWRWESAK